MGKKTILDGNASAAWGARLSRVQVVPNFPVTPQTEIIETIAQWKANGEFPGEFVPVESEHSVMSAAVASQATGARTFTGSSSQGTLLMHEVIYIASGLRLPIVMVNVSRGLSAPITLWCFTREAQVLMSDLSYKKISEIKEGDVVLGVNRKPGGGDFVPTKVKRTFTRETDKLVKLKTDKFDLVCTGDHKFYYHPNNDRWIKAISLKNKELKWVGYGFDENDEFMRGWLSGVTDVDGCIYKLNVKKHKYYRFQLNAKDKELIDTFIKYANHFRFRIREHDYRKKDGQYGAIISGHKEAKKFKDFIKPKRNLNFCRGYLSGLYDSEGTGPYEKTRSLTIYNTNGIIIKRALSYFDYLGFKYKTYISKRKGKTDCALVNINCATEFFVMCRPKIMRKLNNVFNTTIKSVKKKMKINEVELIDTKKTVYNIETGTNNYIVNGFIVHNCDHNDILDQRDAGWLTFFCERNQEVLDSIIMAYKICEDPRVMLPAFINMDGFYMSFTREPVVIPDQSKVDKFLPPYRPKVFLDPKKPMAQGIGVMAEYPYFRQQVHLAQKNALEVIEEVQNDFSKRFRRKYEIIESYMMEGAESALIILGSNSTIAKAAVRKMRKKGKKIGLLRLRVFRPFPREMLIKLTKGLKAIGVIDQNLAPGSGGIVFNEVRSALHEMTCPISDFIISLGGKPIAVEEFEGFADFVIKSAKTGKADFFFQD